MSKFSFILVLQKKQENLTIDMVKIQIKSESLTPFGGLFSIMEQFDSTCRVNQQVQNYKTCLKNSRFGVEKFNFSLGLSFSFFCMDIILLSV